MMKPIRVATAKSTIFQASPGNIVDFVGVISLGRIPEPIKARKKAVFSVNKEAFAKLYQSLTERC